MVPLQKLVKLGISQAGIFAAIDSRSHGLVEVCADVGIAASAEREEAVALAADKIECRIHGIGEDGVVAARLLNGLRYPGGKTAVVIADFTRDFDAPGKAIAAAAERVEAGIPYLSVGQAWTKVDACCAFDEPLAERGSRDRSGRGHLGGGGTGLLCAQRGRAAKTHEEEKRERKLAPTEIHSIS